MPPAKRRPTQIAYRLQKALEAAQTAAGVPGEVYIEIGYKIGPRHWFQPDISLTHLHQSGDDYFEGSPQLAVEIVSVSNTAKEIELKIEDYHTYGAKEVWVLYPESRHLWVYAAKISAQRHSGVFLSQFLDGEPIDLDQILAI